MTTLRRKIRDREAVLLAQEVLVRNIRVPADIGVHAHEIGQVQTLIVDVRLGLRPLETDRLSETVDYNAIVAYALSLGRERISLIETFARRLAEICLAHLGVREVEVRVEKPGALPVGVASARVILHKFG